MSVGKLKNSLGKRISEEIEDLSDGELEKIIKKIQLIKREFLEEKKASFKRFKRARGGWKDVDVEKIYKKFLAT